MLQAEILVQYGMRSKAIERLQRIQELFPREEERNQELQRLYIAAGIEPQYAKSAADARRRRRHRCAAAATSLLRQLRPLTAAAGAGMRPTSAVWRKSQRSRASSTTRATPKAY